EERLHAVRSGSDLVLRHQLAASFRGWLDAPSALTMRREDISIWRGSLRCRVPSVRTYMIVSPLSFLGGLTVMRSSIERTRTSPFAWGSTFSLRVFSRVRPVS